MSSPRDPRLRRQQHRDPLAAAVALDLAVSGMRAAAVERGPEPLIESVAAAVQLGAHEPPLTAEEFAAALAAADQEEELPRSPYAEMYPDPFMDVWPGGEPVAPPPVAPEHWLDIAHAASEPVAESPAPPPVAPVPPADPPAAAPAEVPIGEHPDDIPVPDLTPRRAFSPERSRTLNWRSRHDPRSLAYGIRERLNGQTPLQDVLLPSSWPTLDQGAEGACVGCAVVGARNTLQPATEPPLDFEDALRLYKWAQRLDAFPGEAYEGTSVLAGMQAAVGEGLFGGYLWAFGTRDIAQAVLNRRPVIVGIPWLPGMYETGPGGLVEVTGEDEGLGHALAVVGIRLKGPQGQPGPFFVWHNSWGDDYGDGGLGYIHHRHLALLLRGRGEAAIPTVEPQAPR